MSNPPTTGKLEGELQVREAMLPAKLRDWRAKLSDRVVQTAVVLILEPIFESDFLDCSYGFRPGRSAHDALEVIRQNLVNGRCTVYDADMEGCFDSIPHDKLIACVRMRVVDGSVLRLIKQWLRAPVEEKDENGRPRRRRSDKGTT